MASARIAAERFRVGDSTTTTSVNRDFTWRVFFSKMMLPPTKICSLRNACDNATRVGYGAESLEKLMPRLLVVDSDSMLHNLYKSFFSVHGYEVETVSTALECIEKIRLRAIDVVCLDMTVLWGGGEGVIAAMQENILYSWIPVVIIDHNAQRDGIASAPNVFPLERFQKPFRFSALLEVLHRIS